MSSANDILTTTTNYEHLPPLCPQHTLFHTNILLNPSYTLAQTIELVDNYFKAYSTDLLQLFSWDAWTHSWSGRYYPDLTASCEDESCPPYTCFTVKLYRCRENRAQFMIEWQRCYGDRFIFYNMYSHFTEYVTAAANLEAKSEEFDYTTYISKPPKFGENIEKEYF